MRVQKIIQSYPDLFDVGNGETITEKEAIEKISAMQCQGNDLQKEAFRIRQTYFAICNLFSLGFRSTAVELAIELIPQAEIAQNYTIAQDLCGQLIAHYYQIGDLETVHLYKSLYDLFTLNIANEHSSMVLFGKAIFNQKKLNVTDFEEIKTLLTLIERNLSLDPLWNRYYYFQFNAFLKSGEDLEQLYLAAIDYFENLHLQHDLFTLPFYDGLINHYLAFNKIEKSEKLMTFLESGSDLWYRYYLLIVRKLIHNNDIRSNDLCIMTMNHPSFTTLPIEQKEEWKQVYKTSVRILLDFK